jgi:hypothetical protein
MRKAKWRGINFFAFFSPPLLSVCVLCVLILFFYFQRMNFCPIPADWLFRATPRPKKAAVPSTTTTTLERSER